MPKVNNSLAYTLYLCVLSPSVPPVISKDVAGEGFFPREIKIKVNNTLTLECEAQAIPTPTLQWYKDGQVRDTSPVKILFKATKFIILCFIFEAQVSDTGRYTCVASNISKTRSVAELCLAGHLTCCKVTYDIANTVISVKCLYSITILTIVCLAPSWCRSAVRALYVRADMFAFRNINEQEPKSYCFSPTTLLPD
uniref:Ig-like domain-containing protein n=1 Tax=Astyanax mexicanus TaxID=7994 RepID=A0A3B1IRI7_ASTMX